LLPPRPSPCERRSRWSAASSGTTELRTSLLDANPQAGIPYGTCNDLLEGEYVRDRQPGSSSAFGFWIGTENESGLEPVRTARVSASCVSTGFELYGFCIGL
jgi:hypothetical protein